MSGEKTEEPSAKRLADARRRGEVPKSRDLVAFASLLAAFVVATHTAFDATHRLSGLVVSIVRRVATPLDRPAIVLVVRDGVAVLVATVAPILLAALVVGVVVARLDAGSVFAIGRIAPKVSRLDPASGAKQIVSRERFVDLAKSFAMLGVVSAIVVLAIRAALPSLPHLVASPAARSLGALGTLVARVVALVLVALAVLGAFDVYLSRRQFLRAQRMTKDEVKREHKDAEGDPRHKSERAHAHREIVEHSVLEGVRRADVLVVNPTHLAVALRFDEASDQNAPEVVAKGEDELAKRMIEAAREAGVPVMRDIPLARSLYDLELGDEIPEALFEAVAAVLRAAWAEREADS